MKGCFLIMLGLAVLTFANSSDTEEFKMTPELEAIFRKYYPGYKTFSVNLYQLLSKQASGDLVVSPLSTQYTLALILAGAKGRTQTELRKAMCYNLTSTDTKKLWIAMSKGLNCQHGSYKSTAANIIFNDNDFPVRDGFKAIAENHYRSVIKTVDFGRPRTVVQVINSWIKARCPKIPKLLESHQVTKTTRLVLANSLYVSAKWQNPFNKEKTETGVFHLGNGKTKDVNYMHGSKFTRFAYDEALCAKFLELPLEGGHKSIVIVLPTKKNGLKELEAKMKQVLAFDDFEHEHVNITLPRFNFNTQLHLKPILQKLGLRRAFSPNAADLSGISEKRGVYLNLIVQKAFINVNEVGLEAAAAGVTPASKAAANVATHQFGVNFVADHPFLFYLKVAPRTPLFIGRVVTPETATPIVHARAVEEREIEGDNENDNDNDNDNEDN